jgi:hypothetical protein
MFHMTNDSGLFRSASQLESDGYYRVARNRWKKGKAEYLPLYEGKMVQAFDHRAASVVINAANINRPAQPEPASTAQHADPSWLPAPQFWVAEKEIDWPNNLEWAIGFKDVTSPTNVRTMIAAAVPRAAFGNTLPLIMPDTDQVSRKTMTLWLANLNSIVLDFVARQKVQGQHLNWYVVEQLPVVPAGTYEQRIGKKAAGQIIQQEVLRLTYTADDMRGFAKDQGYVGDPFVWNEEERRHSKARLDAVFFLLYGVEEADANYILSTFPIVREQDEAAHGRYLTRDLIIAYMRAFKAGDTETKVAP